MLFIFIATLAGAIAVWGSYTLLNRFIFAGKLPKWLLPAGIALVIIGLQIFDEYDWFRRKMVEWPENMVIVEAKGEAQIYRPWTFIATPITQITAYNRDSREVKAQGEWAGTLIIGSRLGSATAQPIFVNCPSQEMAIGNGEDENLHLNAIPENWYQALCQE